MAKPPHRLVDIDRAANLLGRPPGWMLYWGNTMVFLLVLLVLGLASLIRYPSEVQATVRLTTQPTPLRQLMSRDGEVATILWPATDQVTEGDPLLVLASTANWVDVQRLEPFLDTLSQLIDPTEVLGLVWNEDLEIGSLRPTYARLLNHLSELQYWLLRSQQGDRAANLQRQLAQNEEVARQLTLQASTARAEYELAEINFLRFDSLLQRGSASQLEVDQAKAQSLQAKFRLEQQQGRQLDNQLSRERLSFEKLSLVEQLSDEVTRQWLGLKRELRKLQYEYHDWCELHVLQAQATGTLTLLNDLREGQQLRAQTPLWGIVPNAVVPRWVAVGNVSDNALGKIEVGDTALIRLPAYPYREYGQLPAVVAEISLLPETNEASPRYRLELHLPQGLTTSYQRSLDVRQSLSGQARIISEKRSLLARVFDRLWQIKERLHTG